MTPVLQVPGSCTPRGLCGSGRLRKKGDRRQELLGIGCEDLRPDHRRKAHPGDQRSEGHRAQQVRQRTGWGNSHKEPVWCPAHTEERRGNGGECLEEAEKRLSCVMLWENASVLKSGPEGLPHFREHQGTDLSDGKRPNCESPKCPSGKKSGSCCQESQA